MEGASTRRRIATPASRWLAALARCTLALAATAQPLDLDERERAWIAANPLVPVGLAAEFPPYDSRDERSGHALGFVVAMLDLWSQRTGLRFVPVALPHQADAIAALRRGDIDTTPFTAPLPQRADALVYTCPAFTTDLVVAARRVVPDVSPPSNFGARRVAVETGSIVQALLRQQFAQLRLHGYDDAGDAPRAVAAGHEYLLVGYPHTVVYHVENNLLANVELRRSLGPGTAPLGPAVRRDPPELAAILDQAIASVTPADRSRLAARWLPAGALTPLTAARVELGEFDGLGADAPRLAAGKVGIDVVQEVGASFAEVHDATLAGDIDVVVGMARTPLRRLDFDFVGPFARVPTALFVAADGAAVSDTAQVGVRKLALLRVHRLIPEGRARHPGIQLVEVDRQDQVLVAVAEGAAQVGLGNIKVVDDSIEQRFAGQLRIAGIVGDGDSELYFAVPRRLPELTWLLRRGFEAADDSEWATLQSRWMAVQVRGGTDRARVAAVVLPVAAALLAYLFLLARGNRRLRAARRAERDARRLAEDATAARGRLLAYLWHELRGGLGSIAAGAELLRCAPGCSTRSGAAPRR